MVVKAINQSQVFVSNPVNMKTVNKEIDQKIQNLLDSSIISDLRATTALEDHQVMLGEPVLVERSPTTEIPFPAGTSSSIIPVHEFPPSLAEVKALPTVEQAAKMQQRIEMSQQFRPGDIIVTRRTGHHHVEKVDYLIQFFQKIAKILGFASKTADTSIVHIGVVVGTNEQGRVIISEAMPGKRSGLRTVDLFEHDSCRLEKGLGYEYQIFRMAPQYQQTAEKAAQIAERFAPKASYLLSGPRNPSKGKNNFLNKFSFIKGLKAILTRSKTYDEKAQKRTFKGIFEEHIQADVSISGKKKGRKMFCSAFGCQVFQKSAANQAWEKLVEQHPELKTQLEELEKNTEGLTNRNANKQVSDWAKKMAKEYGQELAGYMSIFNLDFKHTTPQDLVVYLQHKGIASRVFDLVPAK